MAEYIKRVNKACREFNNRLKPIIVVIAKAMQKAWEKGKSDG